jgi:hypothetical protein
MDTGEEQGSIRVKVARTAINGLRGALSAVASDPDVVERATATELVAAGLDIAIRETSNLDRAQVMALGGSKAEVERERLIDAGKNWVVT